MNETDRKIVDSYNGLFQVLSFQNKPELIERLSKLLKADSKDKDASFYKSFGAFPDGKTAERIVRDLKISRKFRRKDIRF